MEEEGAWLGGVFPLYLPEVLLEFLRWQSSDNKERSETKWDRAKRTLGRGRQVVLPIAKAGHAVPDADATAQLQVEDVALVEEEDHLRVLEPLARAHRLPQQVAVLEPVHAPVLHELLVEARDWREEDDHDHVVEVGAPCRALCEDVGGELVSRPGHPRV